MVPDALTRIRALRAERRRIREQADAEAAKVLLDIVAAMAEALPGWEAHSSFAKRDRKPGGGHRYPVSLVLYDEHGWAAYAAYRPSDNSPAGAQDRTTDAASGPTPRDALASLAADVDRLIPRMRRPEIIADLRHLREWLRDVIAELPAPAAEVP
mgnify:CR=1 FL=1